jgi:hypothetical protein
MDLTNLIEVAAKFKQTGVAVDLEPLANAKILTTYFEGRAVYSAE